MQDTEGKGQGAGLLGKISRPQVHDLVRRERLWALLDAYQERALVWVTGPPGSGKTSLLAGYLAARPILNFWYRLDESDQDLASFFEFFGAMVEQELPRSDEPLPRMEPAYLPSLSIFTRRFFRAFGRRLSGPTILVFDDYQELPAEALPHALLPAVLEELPAQCTVFILSRQPPPAGWARWVANGRLATLGWSELRFLEEEAAALIARRYSGGETAGAMTALIARAQGWAGGLILLIECCKSGILTPRTLDTATPELLFDYFSVEILEKLAPEAAPFLLRTAFLPEMTVAVAQALTGDDRAGLLLERLAHGNTFTTRHADREPVYRYHPLFRDYLLKQAPAVLGAAACGALEQRAAELLENSAYGITSLRYYRAADDWERFTRVLARHASHWLQQGRHLTLSQILQTVPPDIQACWPTLSYWKGMCEIYRDPKAAQAAYEIAYCRFMETRESAMLGVAWSGIVESVWYGRDTGQDFRRLYSDFQQLRHHHGDFDIATAPARVVVCAYLILCFLNPRDPELPQWQERVLQLIRAPLHGTTRMMACTLLLYHSAWLGGGRAMAQQAMESIRAIPRSTVSPLEEIYICYCECNYHWIFTSEIGCCIESAEAGLAKAAEYNLPVLNVLLLAFLSVAHLSEEHTASHHATIDRFQQVARADSTYEQHLYHFIKAYQLWLDGELDRALDHAERAYQLAEPLVEKTSLGFSLFALAQIHYSRHNIRQARYYLIAARRLARKFAIHYLSILCGLAGALLALALGKTTRCRFALGRSLALARLTGNIRFL